MIISWVSDMFAALYTNRPIPTKSTVDRTNKKFKAKGTVINNCGCEPRKDHRAEDVKNDRDLRVLLCMEENEGIISNLRIS